MARCLCLREASEVESMPGSLIPFTRARTAPGIVCVCGGVAGVTGGREKGSDVWRGCQVWVFANEASLRLLSP